jgi:hypothetical protein
MPKIFEDNKISLAVCGVGEVNRDDLPAFGLEPIPAPVELRFQEPPARFEIVRDVLGVRIAVRVYWTEAVVRELETKADHPDR